MSKTGLTKDVFSTPESQPAEKRQAGKPKIGKPDKLLKVTVGLEPRQVNYLDDILYKMKSSNVEAFHVKRSEIVRAILNALESSGVKLNEAQSPEEIEEILIERINNRSGN